MARFADLLLPAMEALEELYNAYCDAMASEFDYPGRPWIPERDNDTAALKGRAVLAQFAERMAP